jgi:hypothetical protein
LKIYTPFRLKPRIFPAVVSATVAVSEAITKPPPHSPVTDFVLGGASVMGSETALAGRMAKLAKPAPKVAMPLMKERRPLNAEAGSRFGGLFDFIFALHLRLFAGAIFGSTLWPESVRVIVFCSRNATLMCLAS